MELTSPENSLQSEPEGKLPPETSLRSLELSNVDNFMVWATDDRVSRFCRWNTFTSRERCLDFLRDVAIPNPWLTPICIENRPVGSISVTPGSGNDRCRGEIGYVLAFRYWGQGSATQAAKMVISTIFSEWPHLERVEALVLAENPASHRVLEKAGFVREGLLRKYLILKGKTRDIVMYSFLSSDDSMVSS